MRSGDSVLGLDEAGRGPLLGPMVICGVYGSTARLRSLGVRDSKKLRPEQREQLSIRLKEEFEWKTVAIWPSEIDEAVDKGGLNELEARYFAQVIREMGHESAIVDCADVNEDRFGRKISMLSGCSSVIARHKADVNHPSVSAASIIAKTMRDSIMADIQAQTDEPIGSGYPSDAVTVRYVTEFYRKNAFLPPFVRKSWEPVKHIVSISKIKNLDDFR